MKPFETLIKEDLKNIKYVKCDVEETIITEGKLTPEAYNALWKLQEAGIGVIPVTGRPAGWCDMIINKL